MEGNEMILAKANYHAPEENSLFLLRHGQWQNTASQKEAGFTVFPAYQAAPERQRQGPRVPSR
jgi:hypothetical protein